MVTLKRIKQDENKGKCERVIINGGDVRCQEKNKKYKDQQIQYKKKK